MLLPVRITPRKNIELAIRVLEQLREHMPTANLVITGPLGPHNPKNIEYFEELTELRSELHLENSVHFLAELSESYLPDEVIADFYNLADALLMPSREEGFGIPILEAGLSGIPVFCSDIPPLRELGKTQAQYFSPEGDPIEIAKMIAKRIANDPLYQFRVRVKTKYPWEGIYQKHIAPLLKP
jgi:glycosyltransferase involved in cell wall biosynthesis